MRRSPARRGLPILALILAVALWGCGEGDGDRDGTGFERALGDLGAGVSVGSGFGWADLRALEGDPAGLTWTAEALGPGADDLLEESELLARTTGFDPASASAAVAEGGSYAFGVRFDGVEGGRLGELLQAAGASRRQSGEWWLYDLGTQAEGQTSGPLAPLGALASRVAVGPSGVVLSRFEPARSSLIGEADEALELGAAQELAVECLGEVLAARLVPGTFTHQPVTSPRLTAIGVAGDADRRREVLCALDDPEREAPDRIAALERTFAPGAVDELTGKPIAREVAGATVSEESKGEWRIARAELELAPDARPGFLLRAFSRGSVLTYLGSRRPIPRAD